MPRPARVSRCSEAYRNPRARAQGGHQLENRSRRRESADFLDVEPRVGVALILISVGIALKIRKPQARAVRGTPHLLGLVVLPPKQAVDGPRTLDRLDQLGPGAPQHQADRVLAVAVGVVRPLAKHTIGLAAPARATEEHLKDGAFQERHLRRVAAGCPLSRGHLLWA